MKSLEDLDRIGWGEFEHAHGAASDVPGLLRGLASTEWEARQDAYHRLISTIWHQGTVYDATVEAVPFLLTLVNRPSGPTSIYAAAVLALIAGSAFSPLVDADIDDDSERGAVRRRLAALRAQLEATRDALASHDPRHVVLRAVLDEVSARTLEQLEEAYATCEMEADALNEAQQRSPTAIEFETWLAQNPSPDRSGQVHAIGWAREHATEYPGLAAEALERVQADHLLQDKRLVEALVALGRGEVEPAVRQAVELAEEWLEPAEVGGLNQVISRASMLAFLDAFSHEDVVDIRARIEAADDPEWVIPEDW
jgi:hypothetical protein